MRKLLLILTAVVSFSPASFGGNAPVPDEGRAAPTEFRFHFRTASHVLDTAFFGNGSTARALDRFLEGGAPAPDTVRIRSTASPDGPGKGNVSLARNRGLALTAFLRERWPSLSDAVFIYEIIPEDWDTFRRIVEDNPSCPRRDEVVLVLQDAGLSSEARKRSVSALKPFYAWYLDGPATLARYVSVSLPGTATPPLPSLPAPGFSAGALRGPSLQAPVTARRTEKDDRRVLLAFRSNLLVPLLNVGVEVPLCRRLSLGLDYYYPWFVSKGNRWCCEMLALFGDLRWWFAPAGRDGWTGNTLLGHAAGLYCGAGYYDFQWQESGYQGEFLDFGADYTFAFPLGDLLRMELNVGVGCIAGRYRHYNPTDDWSILLRDRDLGEMSLLFIGPTRASVSIVLPICARVRK